MNKITSFNVENKRVIIRCDYNVTIKDNVIVSNERIIESLESINYLIENKAKIIIMSHLGKVKDDSDKKNNSLLIVYQELCKLINTPIYFSENIEGAVFETKVNSLKPGEILLMENTRFADLDGKRESECQEALSKYWASFGDFFINDAFGMIHRCHASNYGIAKYLPSGIGFLMEKELNGLDLIINSKRPFTVVMSGAKLDDKIVLIKEIVKKCDYLLLGGAIANTFLSINHKVGKSLVSTNCIEEVKMLYDKYKNKIILPIDVISLNNNQVLLKDIKDLNDNDQICDLGNNTIIKYQDIINLSQTIFLNGTVGIYEDKRFENGTESILKSISEAKAIRVIGGGDALTSSQYFKITDFDFSSTGGGATLYYLAFGRTNIF